MIPGLFDARIGAGPFPAAAPAAYHNELRLGATCARSPFISDRKVSRNANVIAYLQQFSSTE